MSGYQWPHKVMQGHLKDQAIFGFPTDVSQAGWIAEVNAPD